MATLHYFYDAMCGWCYGATPLVNVIAEIDSLKLEMHPGGMMERQAISNDFRQHILVYDKRIAELTGQVFGQPYQEKVSGSELLIVDSYLTEQAIIAMDNLNGRGLDMLKAIQVAHYQHGLDTSNSETLTKLAADLGVDEQRWQQQMQQAKSAAEQAISESRRLMQQWQIQGFPTFILENRGNLTRLPHTQFYSDPRGWQNILENR